MTTTLTPPPAAATAFTVAIDRGIAVLTLDLPGEPVNKLSRLVIDEFLHLHERLLGDDGVRAIVLISGKPDVFVAGADIEEFTKLASQADAEAMSREGQRVMDRVAESPKPYVAAVHGSCLGGGLELALACRAIVATDSPKTQLGLPEVQLGLVPGAGGCNRLPRRIGLRAALDIILAGKSERAPKAYKLGLCDELVAPPILRPTAIAIAEKLARGEKLARREQGGLVTAILDRTPVGRAVVYRQARETVLRKTGGHYPAPLMAIDVIRTSMERGMAEGMAAEHRAFGELAVGAVSRNLVRIFFATTALKKDDGVDAAALPRPGVTPIRRLGVVGAGFMGAGIAGTAALNADVEVRLRDSELPRVGKGLKASLGILDDRLKRRRLTRPEYMRKAALLTAAADWSGFGRADCIIEAVFEDLAVKRGVVAELETVLPEDAIIASNTSTIPIGEIAALARHPERILGMHFFSPVEKMPLLEIIPHAGTAPEAIVRSVRFGRKMGKTVIVVADRPGFWVNRILSPYLNEAGHLMEEGVPIELIDGVMTKFGFPVGPVTLLDEVGLDVAQKGSKVMHAAFGERLRPSSAIEKLVADGRLGRKNGRGFLRYEGGRKQGVDPGVAALLGVTPKADADAAEVEQRLLYAMLNEAALAAGEGVVRSARDGDIGAIFGIGFPPFRGGPLRLLDEIGARQAVGTLEELARVHGGRFTPAPALVALADARETFHHDGHPRG